MVARQLWMVCGYCSFPTKRYMGKLQNNPNMKHACGRPSVNGGYIDNPYIKFGAKVIV